MANRNDRKSISGRTASSSAGRSRKHEHTSSDTERGVADRRTGDTGQVKRTPESDLQARSNRSPTHTSRKATTSQEPNESNVSELQQPPSPQPDRHRDARRGERSSNSNNAHSGDADNKQTYSTQGPERRVHIGGTKVIPNAPKAKPNALPHSGKGRDKREVLGSSGKTSRPKERSTGASEVAADSSRPVRGRSSSPAARSRPDASPIVQSRIPKQSGILKNRDEPANTKDNPSGARRLYTQAGLPADRRASIDSRVSTPPLFTTRDNRRVSQSELEERIAKGRKERKREIERQVATAKATKDTLCCGIL
jgi:hypothetical protein